MDSVDTYVDEKIIVTTHRYLMEGADAMHPKSSEIRARAHVGPVPMPFFLPSVALYTLVHPR